MEYTLVRKKVRNANIKITYDNKVVVTVPVRFTDSQAERFVSSKQQWINKTLNKINTSRKKIIILPTQILLFGKPFTKAHNPLLKNKIKVDFKNEIIESDMNLNSKIVLEHWYKLMANDYFTEQVIALAEKFNLKYNRITIRSQKSRWGSCSHQKNLSFNWKLVKAPRFVIDYIILHELAHTKFLNHSDSYWKFVETICPDYQTAEAWLKKFGNNL